MALRSRFSFRDSEEAGKSQGWVDKCVATERKEGPNAAVVDAGDQTKRAARDVVPDYLDVDLIPGARWRGDLKVRDGSDGGDELAVGTSAPDRQLCFKKRGGFRGVHGAV